jgi:CMP-N-acetylneuraminic acid synthetase
MKKNNIFWAIIPARSGSKSIKNKNIIKFNGHPLIAYAIAEAKKTKKIKKVLVSSDSRKYLKIAKKYGADILHLRSKKNSSDKSTDFDFFKEIDNYLKNNLDQIHQPNFFVHLRPNCPIRRSATLNKAIEFFEKKKNFSAMRSVEEMSETGYKNFEIIDNKLKGICNGTFNIEKQNGPKENFNKTYKANGYIDIISRKNIRKNYLHGSQVLPFLVTENVVDIDGKKDLAYVQYLFKKLKYFKYYNFKINLK